MKKLLLFALLAVIAVCVNAQETDVTTLDWTQKGQGCTNDFNNPNGGTVFGTDAGGSNLSYVDVSAYGQINLYGTPGQRARLFVNREEIGDKGIIYVDINDEGVGVYDFNGLLALQPTIQYIHLNGVKASAYNTTLNLSKITVSGSAIPFPTDVWTCPEGETDVTKLSWTLNAQGCTNNLGTMTDVTVWGTDAGGTNISYVDLSDYGTIKVYGPAGQRARFFINREEFGSNYQFYANINDEGVGELSLANVLASQEGATYIHLNGIKAATWGEKLQINGITAIEKDWDIPEGEINYVSLPGYKDVNNIGNSLNGGEVVYGDQSNGNNYTDVTEYNLVKFYGTPGAMLRVFVNRAGGEGVIEGKSEQRVTIGEDGVGTLDVAAVMAATEKEYCYISGIKIAAAYQGASIDTNIKIKGITVVKTSQKITIGAAGYATFVTPCALDFTDSAIEAYAISELTSGSAKLTKLTQVPAGEAIVVKGATGTVPAIASAEAITNLLTYSESPVTANGSQYILAKVNIEGVDKIGFAKAATGTTIAAGKGYFVSSTSAKSFSIEIEEEDVPLAIQSVSTTSSNAAYNLAGQRVAPTQKGIVIINGKKIFNK